MGSETIEAGTSSLIDHIGWNTRLENGRWVPSVPKAKYLFADREAAFWTDKERAAPGKQPWIVDSVLPIMEAGRQEVVTSLHELSDIVGLIPTPGHTIDHYLARIGKLGADAVIGGDMIPSPSKGRLTAWGDGFRYNPVGSL